MEFTLLVYIIHTPSQNDDSPPQPTEMNADAQCAHAGI